MHGCGPPFVGMDDAEVSRFQNKCLALRAYYTSFPPEYASPNLAILLAVLKGGIGRMEDWSRRVQYAAVFSEQCEVISFPCPADLGELADRREPEDPRRN